MSSHQLDRPALRKLLFAVLMTDSDLEAFCLDYVPDTQRRFTVGMDRQTKVSLVLEREDASAVLQALLNAYPKAVEQHLAALGLPAASRDADGPQPAQTAPAAGGRVHAGQWDFFIAHAGFDTAPALVLHALLLQQGHRPYLDKKDLLPGDDWNVELPKAQRQARITVVLISTRTEPAYYQREEIAAAIALASDPKYSHRVVPVYLNGWPDDAADVPYGLRGKHGLNAIELGGMAGIAQTLDELIKRL